MAVFVITLVCVDDGWQSTCGGGLGIIFWAKFKICHCRCQTLLPGLKVFSVVIVRGLMCIAYMPHVDVFDILAVGHRWKCT